MKETTTAIKGKEGFEKFAPFLTERAITVQSPCEGFAVIQLGPFKGGEGHIAAASIVLLEVGGEHPQHKHGNSDATLHFVSGKGNVVLGEDQIRVPYQAGTVIEVPRTTLHGFEVEENGVMLATQKGDPIIGEHGEVDIEYRDPRCFTIHGTVL